MYIKKRKRLRKTKLDKEIKSKGEIASIVLTKHLSEHREGGFYEREKDMGKKST